MGNCCFKMHHEGYACQNETGIPVPSGKEDGNKNVTKVSSEVPQGSDSNSHEHENGKDTENAFSVNGSNSHKSDELELLVPKVPEVIITTPKGTSSLAVNGKDGIKTVDDVKIVLDVNSDVKDSGQITLPVDDMTDEEFFHIVPETSFTEYMLSEMSKYGDSVALIDSVSGDKLTYTEVICRIHKLAGGLQTLGLTKGDVLCITTPNNIDYPVIMLATQYIGGIFQVANPLDTSDDYVRCFTECKTKFVVISQDSLEKMRDVFQRVDSLQDVIVFGESEEFISFQTLLQNDQKVDPPHFDPKVTPALMLPSSGTTGLPKAVQHSHYSITAFLHQMAGVNSAPTGSCCIQFLPMYHVFGILISTSSCLQQGLKVIVMSRFFPEQYFDLIQTHSAYILHAVPPTLLLFTKHPKVSDYDLSSVKVILCGAAPLKEELENLVKKRIGADCILHQGYGLTEAPVLFANRGKSVKVGSCGKLLPATKYKVIDPDTKEILNANTHGELCVKGPQVMMGYLNRPEATAQTFDKEGWMHTGDKAYVDKDGYMFIVGRLKELIKYKGHQVPPAQLEDILIQHPGIADAAVIGVPDEEAGELPRAFLVKKQDSNLTESEVLDFVHEKVAPHMKLRGGVVFVDQIPRSGSGKILRRVIEEKYLSP